MTPSMELVSIFQPDDPLTGVEQSVTTNLVNVPSGQKRKLASLPDSYINVPPAANLKKIPPIPKFEGANKADCLQIPQAMQGTLCD